MVLHLSAGAAYRKLSRFAPGRSITSGRHAGEPLHLAAGPAPLMPRGNLRRALALAFKRTPRGIPRKVRLYETSGCGLCAETFRELSRLALDVALEIERVDIGADPVLVQRYALRVPVVAVDGREFDAAGSGEERLRAFVTAS